MQLSPNFTLEEFTISQVAARLGLDNTPKGDVLENIKFTANEMEKVRSLLSYPIIISSGYRSPQVNAAVKGAANSQHLEGRAADFTSPKFGTPKQIIEKILSSNIQYDQVIYEFNTWVHISFSPKNRKQALVIDLTGTRNFV
jgi:hypothetical protein